MPTPTYGSFREAMENCGGGEFPYPMGSCWAIKKVQDPTLDFQWKNSVRAASVANVTVASAPSTLDGVTLAAGDRVLLKDQNTGSQNGIYVFAAASSALTRATDFADAATALPSCAIPVMEGSTNADTIWLLTTNAPIVVGTTSLAFSQLGASVAFPITVAHGGTNATTASDARTNLGIGTAGTHAAGDFLAAANNLSDVTASTARTNLGLGTAAVLDTGTTANKVVKLDGSAKLPAVDGSALTNLPGGSHSSTYIDQNGYPTVAEAAISVAITDTTKPASPQVTYTVQAGDIVAQTHVVKWGAVFDVIIKELSSSYGAINFIGTLNGTEIGTLHTWSNSMTNYYYPARTYMGAVQVGDVLGMKIWSADGNLSAVAKVAYFGPAEYDIPGTGYIEVLVSSTVVTATGALSGVTYDDNIYSSNIQQYDTTLGYSATPALPGSILRDTTMYAPTTINFRLSNGDADKHGGKWVYNRYLKLCT